MLVRGTVVARLRRHLSTIHRTGNQLKQKYFLVLGPEVRAGTRSGGSGQQAAAAAERRHRDVKLAVTRCRGLNLPLTNSPPESG